MFVVLLENPKPIHILNFVRSNYLSATKNRVYHSDRDDQLLGDKNEQNHVVNNQVDDEYDKMDYPEQMNDCWNTHKNIRDLKTAGIRVMANKSDEWQWSNISFTSKWFSGELLLPVFVFNDVKPYFFQNLVAYEMCPDVHYNYECCSFFTFMDSLIDTAEDVKELRLAGVFQNLLGSDEELAKFFNELGDDLPTKMFTHSYFNDAVAYSKKYILVKHQIEKHYTNKWKTWLAQAYNTHFNSPWAMIAFSAALLALVLTFIQTWFAVGNIYFGNKVGNDEIMP
ncbi:hypothetical protein SESBI_19447 [Sesbania bispinosa]|nr:hypothetical protein SESBI_19447 [Sesbania bispinosa]